MGGGTTTTVTPSVSQTPEPNYGNIPNFSALAGEGTNQLSVAGPFSQAGAGYMMEPSAELGQVQMPGPNPTEIGQPEGTAAMEASFGQLGAVQPQQSGIGGSGGKAGAGPAAGGSNVSPLATGNSSFGSVLNSLGGLLGNTGVPQAGLQGLTGGGVSPYGMGGPPTGAQQASPQQQAAMGMQQQLNGGVSPQQSTAGASPQQQAYAGMQNQVNGTNPSIQTVGSPLNTVSATQPGQAIPNTLNSTYAQVPQAVPQATSNQFLNSEQTAPYYNQAAVAGNLGTSSGAAVPAAGNFMNSLFSPGLSQMSQDYLQAGASNAGLNMAQGINQLQSQYQTDPFNNQLGNSEANLISQTANNTLQTAAGMGVQQQQIAANQMSTPYNLTAQNAATPVQDAQGLFNTANAAYGQYTAEPLALLGQTPTSTPVVGSTTTSSSSFL